MTKADEPGADTISASPDSFSGADGFSDAQPNRNAALRACVARMKAQGLTGKPRDDAAAHFLAGVAAVQSFPSLEGVKTYLDVLEALAD